MENNVGVLRGVFDPPHLGHLSTIVNSIRILTLSKLYIIVKFMGEKEPFASSQDRINMMKIQLKGYNLPVKVIRQNVMGHVDELLKLKREHPGNMINICGSDKSIREINMYGNTGDIFGIVLRPEFQTREETIMAAKKRKIEIVEINGFATSSTMIRSRFIRDDFFQQDVDINVSNYICNNGLYMPYHNPKVKEEFISLWYDFVYKLNCIFPEMKLFELSIPDFNPLQNKNGWLEKYIRVIVRYFNLKGDKLVEFIKEAEKRII